MRAQTATVLFTDLVASSEMRKWLGDDAADEIRREHDRLLERVVAAHGGVTVKSTGDGVMAVFEAAAEAVAAGVGMQQATYRLAQRRGVEVAMRVGLSAGDVSWENDDCFGTPVVEASRICGAAAGGQILAADIVRVLAGSRLGHAFEPAGTMSLKGLDAEATVVAVPWQPLAVAAPFPPGLERAEGFAFVGRTAEATVLAAEWRRVLEGGSRAVLIAGEPGIGKTTLAAEASRDAHGEGGVVLFGRCDEDLGVPYQPFVEAVRQLVTTSDDLAEHVPSERLAELAPLVPELGVTSADRVDPETERYRMFEGVTDLFKAISVNAGPVVLVVDDLHWAAKPTLLMLRHLLRAVLGSGAARVLVICTYRDTELGRGHPLADVLADLRALPGVTRLPLGGLEVEAVAALTESSGVEDVDAALLHNETDGNPFFVGQVLRHLGEASGATRVPEGIREVIGRRLTRLPTVANTALAIAAVVGREFDVAVVEACGGPTGDALVEALEEAARARIVEEVPGVAGRFAFTHALIRQTLYEELSLTRRVRLHWRVGGAIAALPGQREDRLPAIAHHYVNGVLAGDPSVAAQAAVAAADRARDQWAYEDATGLYEQALGLPDVDGQPRYAALFGLAHARLALGDRPGANSAFLDAADAARAMDDGGSLARAVIGYAADLRLGQLDESVPALLDEALAAIGTDDSPERAEMLGLRSVHVGRAGEPSRGADMLDEAVEMARRMTDERALALVLRTRYMRLAGTWHVDELVEVSDELAKLPTQAERPNVPLVLDDCTALFVSMAVADRSRFDRLYQELTARQIERPTADRRYALPMASAVVALAEGRWDAAKADVAEVRSAWPGELGVQLACMTHLAIARREQGRASEVAARQELAMSMPGLRDWASLAGPMYCDLGDLDAATRIVELFADDEFVSGTRSGYEFDTTFPMVLQTVSEVCATTGDARFAPELYDLTVRYSGMFLTYGQLGIGGAADRSIGQLAGLLGRDDEACARYEAAVRAEESFRATALAARTRYWYARALFERRGPGDDDQARRVAQDCVAAADRLGMPVLAAQARRLLF